MSTDKVFIEGLEIEALIGIYDWERRIRQPLVFDLEMAFDNRKPAASDAIADTLVVAGGVGANTRLRERLTAMTVARGGRTCFPRPAFCTDNGAMIAFAGALRLQAGQHEAPAVTVTPRWDMASLPSV